MAKFPSPEWAAAFQKKLNEDPQYAQVAKNWEGDFYFVVEPDGPVTEKTVMYFDLWHGKCRTSELVSDPAARQPAYILSAPYGNFVRVLKGELHPMQALMTRKLSLQGNMAMLMRNVPTVLDFVRCAREVTTSFT